MKFGLTRMTGRYQGSFSLTGLILFSCGAKHSLKQNSLRRLRLEMSSKLPDLKNRSSDEYIYVKDVKSGAVAKYIFKLMLDVYGNLISRSYSIYLRWYSCDYYPGNMLSKITKIKFSQNWSLAWPEWPGGIRDHFPWRVWYQNRPIRAIKRWIFRFFDARRNYQLKLHEYLTCYAWISSDKFPNLFFYIFLWECFAPLPAWLRLGGSSFLERTHDS